MLKTELNNHKTDQGVQSAKVTMLQSLDKRFQPIYSNRHYYVSTLLDPRFKQRYLGDVTLSLAKDYIMEVTAAIRKEPDTEIGTMDNSIAEQETEDSEPSASVSFN